MGSYRTIQDPSLVFPTPCESASCTALLATAVESNRISDVSVDVGDATSQSRCNDDRDWTGSGTTSVIYVEFGAGHVGGLHCSGCANEQASCSATTARTDL